MTLKASIATETV